MTLISIIRMYVGSLFLIVNSAFSVQRAITHLKTHLVVDLLCLQFVPFSGLPDSLILLPASFCLGLPAF